MISFKDEHYLSIIANQLLILKENNIAEEEKSIYHEAIGVMELTSSVRRQ